MSVLKVLFGLLAVAIVLLVFFNINVLQNNWLLLGFAFVIVLSLVLAIFDLIKKVVSMIIGFVAFLLFLFLLLVFLKMATV